jgi:hypothetical protein
MKKKPIEFISTADYADLHGIEKPTVRKWLRLGKFPDAKKETTPGGFYYLIPKNAPCPDSKSGRPKGVKDSKKRASRAKKH